jgi:outer membrane lipoprotein-sorting protein
VAFRFIVFALIGFLGALVSDGAEVLAKSKSSLADSAEILRIEAYLNTIQSVQAGFLQISSGGQVAEGRLYLQRPKQLRLDYRPPATVQIYANGYWLAFIDTELEEVSQVPLNSTPAGILVREQVSLSGDVSVTRIDKRADQIRVHLVQTAEPESGVLILAFLENPLRLQNWTVTDAQGVKTRVSLINPKFNLRIDDKLFEFDADRFESSGQ